MITSALLVAALAAQNAPGPMSASLRAHLKSEELTAIAHVVDLPKPIQAALNQMFKTATLDMADPGQPFQVTDVIVGGPLPARRLIVAGCSPDHCLVHFEQGGFAHGYQVVLLSRSKSTATVQWSGLTRGAIPTLADLKAQVVQGNVK